MEGDLTLEQIETHIADLHSELSHYERLRDDMRRERNRVFQEMIDRADRRSGTREGAKATLNPSE